MSLLEDGKVDTSTRVGTGSYKIPGHMIKDSHGSIGVVSVKRAFEESSNAAVAYLINNAYKNNPSQFTDHLYDWKMNEKLGLQIPGEAQPIVKNPKNKSWNKNMTLPQMAYGYEMQLTPLKMLSFYNAIANNGKYVAPIFVREIRRLGNTVEHFSARVINEKICSDKTLKIMQSLLEGVISEGTGRGIVYNPLYKVAGKTGTAQVADGNRGYRAKKQYQASFCGYFPADKPKYSLIVVINDPKNGYYAASVAGPVFREIADKIYASDLDLHRTEQPRLVGNTHLPKSRSGQKKATQYVYRKLGVKALFAANSEYVNVVDTNNGVSFSEATYGKGTVPNVTGMGLRDALYVLGNAGMKVQVKGSGVVAGQSLKAGSWAYRGAKITLNLN